MNPNANNEWSSSSIKSLLDQGQHLAGQEQFIQAQQHFDKVLEMEPAHFEALLFSGLVAYKQKQYYLATGYFQVAHHVNPSNVVVLSNLGSIYKELKHFDMSKALYLKAIQLQDNFAPLQFNFANLLHEMHEYESALVCYQRALALDPKLFQAHTNLGNTLMRLRKNELALESYNLSLSINPNFGLTHANKGKLLKEMHDYGAALKCFDQAIALIPQVAKVYALKAELLNLMKRYDQAVDCYDRVYLLDSSYEFLLGLRLYNKLLYSNWDNFNAELNELTSCINAHQKATQPSQLLSLIDSLPLQLKASKLFVSKEIPPNNALGPLSTRPAPNAQNPRKIKIAYVSADFKHHAVCILLAEMFESHNKDEFEFYGLDATPPSPQRDEMRERVKATFDHFIDIRAMSDMEVAQMARQLEIDIAVDLGGHTHDSRTGAFAYRVAPVQLSYIGYLGTLGAPYMDYLLADETLIPPSSRAYYTEKIAYLPCYQVNDSKRKISDRVFTREELKLPPEGFVYCCFNNSYKINPTVFDAWMQILSAVKGSVLMLLDDHAQTKLHLQKNAALRGVSPERLIFGERLDAPEYLARFKSADLFLDTTPYNAGTTASDALWVGLPVLTLIGETFAARMAASALVGLGVPELIASTQSDYVQMAIELGTEPVKLSKLKQKIDQQRSQCLLFNARMFAQNLEKTYKKMLHNYHLGAMNQHILADPPL